MTLDKAKLEMASRLASRDFHWFVRLVDRGFKVGAFNRYLGGLLQDVADGKLRRLILNTPPQHGKSKLVSQEWPAWLLGRNPKLGIVAASHTQSLCDRNSRMTMRRMRNAAYQSLFQTRLDPRKCSAKEWATIEGGTYKAVGVGGAVTGQPADLLIVDDPYKGQEDSHSQVQRERVWDWFWSDAYTRLQSGAPIVIVMTRWHVDDLVGRLVREEKEKNIPDGHPDKWMVVRLPAIADELDVLGRNIGDPLFPEKYSLQDLESIKLQQGSYNWAGLYQQRPVPDGGNYLDGEKLKVVGPDAAPTDLRWFRFWDLATDEGEKNDYTASARGAMDATGNFYVSGMVRGKWKWPEARTRVKALAEAERIVVGIESVAGFKTAFQNAREVIDPSVRLQEVTVDKDKFKRALPWIALAEAGKMFLVNDGGWVDDFKTEVTDFPNGLHDDQVDAVSGVYGMIKSFKKIYLG